MAVAVGLVGAGRRAAEVHAPALAASPDVDFVGVWTRRAAAAEELANRYGVRPFAQFRDLLASCQATSFAVPPAAQSELGSVAARLGKSVLLEVPISWDVAGAEELAEAVIASHVVSQVAFTWRYTEPVRRFLQEQAPNMDTLGGRGQIVRARPDQRRETNPWRRERGLLFDLGPHVTEFLDAALGPIVDVDAFADPNGSVSLKMEHQVGRSSESTLAYSTAIDHDRAEFEFFGPEESTFVDCSAAEDGADYNTMFAEFAQAVRTGEPHQLDVRRGLHIQRVIEAADSALLLGR
jgi:predicted dehydrogenase